MRVKNLLSVVIILLIISSCQKKINVKFKPFYVTNYRGEVKEFTFLGIDDSMTLDYSTHLDHALHELVADGMEIEVNIIAKVVEYNADSILLMKDSVQRFVAFTKEAFPLKGRLKNKPVVLNSKIMKEISSAYGIQQDYKVELSSMVILNKFNDVK